MKKLFIIFLSILSLCSCNLDKTEQKSDSGIKKATVKVQTDENGESAEQRNISQRLVRDNKIGSIKHLYIVSTYTGDVLEYYTVKGKVTSGNKRLSPKTVVGYNESSYSYNNYVNIAGKDYITDEVLDDGGAFGESSNYLFWFDAQDNYHQYYPSGGTYLHISDKPLRIKKANFTMSFE